MEANGNDIINALAAYFRTDYETVEQALGNAIDDLHTQHESGPKVSYLHRREVEV